MTPVESRPLNILVVDDEPELRASVRQIFGARPEFQDHAILEAADGDEALRTIRERGVDMPGSIHLCLLDVNLPGISGLEVLSQIRSFDPSIIVLIITAHGNIRDAVEAMREGAYDYIEKPVQAEDLLELVGKASEAHSLVHAFGLEAPKITLEGGEQFIGNSQQMRSVFQVIAKLGRVTTSVLVRGENGTGKELVARAIHFNSSRKDKPFVALNCAAIPENLIESEFFGHEKGAFSGADARTIGKFQYAEGGTLFLDEIGDISPAMQVKLLRVLQERKFTPVGSNRELRCDTRIIAATNRNLEKLIAQGRFRQDLYYRLNVMPIDLPPLRERIEDLPTLVKSFIEKFNRFHEREAQGHEIRGIREDALNALRSHDWPGNIRELENIIERAFVLEDSPYITVQALPAALKSQGGLRPASGRATDSAATPPLSGSPSPSGDPGARIIDFQNEKERFEREFIVNALKRFGGKINQTVAHAGIPKNTLLRKMRKYSIQPSEVGGED